MLLRVDPVIRDHESCAVIVQPVCREVIEHQEDVARLEQAFSMLSADHQKVIHCSRYLGMSQSEIAENLDRSVPAVRTLLHRALGRLGLIMHRAEKGSGELDEEEGF